MLFAKKKNLDELKFNWYVKIYWSLNMQLCKVQNSHFRLIIFYHPTDETQSSGYLKTNTSDMMSKRSIYHLEESHLTSMDRLHMRPGGQQQEKQENVGKQPIPQQVSHLLLSDSRFDLPLLCLYSIFSSLFFLFNPLLFLNLIVFLLFPPPPPLQWMMDGLSALFSLCGI